MPKVKNTSVACSGCLATIVAVPVELGGVELLAPVSHGAKLPGGGFSEADCAGSGWPGVPAPGAAREEFVARAQAMSAAVLALPMGAAWAPPGQPTTKVVQRSFGVVPESTVLDGTAVPTSMTLAEDAHVWTTAWCTCQLGPAVADQEVYFERWTPSGRAAHGWACRFCRRVRQTG